MNQPAGLQLKKQIAICFHMFPRFFFSGQRRPVFLPWQVPLEVWLHEGMFHDWVMHLTCSRCVMWKSHCLILSRTISVSPGWIEVLNRPPFSKQRCGNDASLQYVAMTSSYSKHSIQLNILNSSMISTIDLFQLWNQGNSSSTFCAARVGALISSNLKHTKHHSDGVWQPEVQEPGNPKACNTTLNLGNDQKILLIPAGYRTKNLIRKSIFKKLYI